MKKKTGTHLIYIGALLALVVAALLLLRNCNGDPAPPPTPSEGGGTVETRQATSPQPSSESPTATLPDLPPVPSEGGGTVETRQATVETRRATSPQPPSKSPAATLPDLPPAPSESPSPTLPEGEGAAETRPVAPLPPSSEEDRGAVVEPTADSVSSDTTLTTLTPLTPPAPLLRYEVGVYGTLGISQLSSKVAAGSMRPAGVLPGFGADFTWYFAQHWGVTAGAEAAFFNVRLFTVNISTHSSGSPPYLLKQSSRVNATYLRIPLWLRFRAPLGRHWFYAAAGLSADLALSGHYRTETEMRTGSSAATQTTITTGSLSFGHGASLAAETGLRWTLAEHWGLYTGLYAGYGLPDTRPSGDTFSEIGETHLLSAGMKVKIAFGW